ncbi:MAG: TolC family protein [Candidatus Goldbacteria bacterium]|nr:TolC family protein [Candidatus Goldiibacteriota bacterium]
MIKKLFLYLILTIFTLSNSFADDLKKTVEKRKLTYQECYELALKNNREFKMAQLDKQIAEAQMAKAIAAFGPVVSITGGYEPFYKATVIEIPAGVFGPTPMSFPMGTQNYYFMRLSLTQPVFTFGKTFFGYKIAEETYNIANINFKKAREKLELDIISAFYGTLISQQLYKITEESVKRTEEFLKITEKKYKNGQASNFDVLRAKVELANAKLKLKSSETQYKMALENLKNTLGLELEEEIELTGDINYEKLDIVYEDVKKSFEENNDEKKLAKSLENISEYKKNLSIAMLLPSIAVSANLNNYSNYPDFYLENKYWRNSWDVTIGLQWTVFDSFKNIAAVKESSAEAEKQKLNRENMNNMLKIQLDSLFMQINESKEIIEAADETIKQAEEGYRIAKTNYINGLIQSIDLMDAEIMLMQAKINYLNALYNYTTKLQTLKNFIK